jgi:hypothetical protein
MTARGQEVARNVLLVVVSIAALGCAIWFSLPVRVIGSVIDGAPLGRYVEVSVDRVEQIPWVVQNEHHETRVRFALGWIGDRALLIQAEPGLAFEPRMRGELYELSGQAKIWMDQSPRLAAICYGVSLELVDHDLRQVEAFGGIAASLALLMFWLYRLYRWRRPHAVAGDPKLPLGARLDAPRPRSPGLVSAVMWRHAVPRFIALFVLYLLCVMLIPAVVVADWLGLELWDQASAARHFALFALTFAISAPITGLPFFWWVRRRIAEIRRVVRNGDIVDGVLVSLTAVGTRGWFGLSSKLNASHTNLEVATAIGGTARSFHVLVDGRPDWCVPGAALRLLVAAEEQFGIAIAPDGKAYRARPRRSWLRRGGGAGGEGLPTARVVNAPDRSADPAAGDAQTDDGAPST